jgi:hypothetical protein
VLRYIYADTDPDAIAIARHRMPILTSRYGSHLFPNTAWERAFNTLPMNIYQINYPALQGAHAIDNTKWILIAGWECQNLSPAGNHLRGPHSNSYYPLIRTLSAL